MDITQTVTNVLHDYFNKLCTYSDVINSFEKCELSDSRYVDILFKICHKCDCEDDFKIAYYLITTRSLINVKNKHNYTLLTIMCRKMNSYKFKLSKYLIENGIDYNFKTDKGRTALFYLCQHITKYGQKLVSYMFDLPVKPDLNVYSTDGNNPLMLICRKSNRYTCDLIKIFIDNHIDLDYKNKRSETALMITCKYLTEYSKDIVKILFDNNVHINIADNKERTPLIVLCKSKSIYRKQIINMFIKLSTCRMTAFDNKNMTALLYLCKHQNKNNFKTVNELASVRSYPLGEWNIYNRYINHVNKKNENALLLCCKYTSNNVYDIINFFINKKININRCDTRLNNALHVICGNNRVTNQTKFKIVQLLLDYDIDVNSKNIDENSCLHNLLYCKDYTICDKIVKLIVKNKINIHIKNCSGYTPLDITVQTLFKCENSEKISVAKKIVDILTHTGDGIYNLHTDTVKCIYEHFNLSLFEFIVSRQFNPSNFSEFLYPDVVKNVCQIVDIVVDYGYNINYISDDSTSLLMKICQMNLINEAIHILNAGADPNIQSKADGNTAIIYYFKSMYKKKPDIHIDYDQVIQLINMCKASIHIENNKGMDPYDYFNIISIILSTDNYSPEKIQLIKKKLNNKTV